MLLELNIKDFAIIEALSVSFGKGFNLFTGETGAGKSIIIDAIDLVLGGRASTDTIRSGSEEASVEALFDISGVADMEEKLIAAGIDANEGELLVRRVVSGAGRNKIYINSQMATLATLAEITAPLIDICGQSEHQSLTRAGEDLELLDLFGDLTGESLAVGRSFRKMSELKAKARSLTAEIAAICGERELKEFQAQEIDEAALRIEEEDEIETERTRLRNFSKISTATSMAEAELYSSDGSATEKLGNALKELREAARTDERLKSTVKVLSEALIEVEEAAIFLRDSYSGEEFDEAKLEELENRHELITTLKRKYSKNVPELIEYSAELKQGFLSVEGLEKLLVTITEEALAAEESTLKSAAELSAKRQAAALDFQKAVMAELEDLGMKGSVFEVIFDEPVGEGEARRLSEKGFDHPQFYISPNPGEEIKPLKKVASGGELARIMLAIKKCTLAGKVPTLIFDEIDTGVGGAMGKVVGEKLKEVAARDQVFCITHLPQIAALADHHYFISKSSDGKRTVTSLKKLTEKEERVAEIARMLGGGGEKATEHATELLEGVS